MLYQNLIAIGEKILDILDHEQTNIKFTFNVYKSSIFFKFGSGKLEMYANSQWPRNGPGENSISKLHIE